MKTPEKKYIIAEDTGNAVVGMPTALEEGAEDMKKQILSLSLALCMALTLLPAAALEETDRASTGAESDSRSLPELSQSEIDALIQAAPDTLEETPVEPQPSVTAPSEAGEPTPTATPAPVIPIPPTGTAYPSIQPVEVDGAMMEFQMYALRDEKGNPINYVKVRDLALVLNGTKAQFSVNWRGMVDLVPGDPYISVGTEHFTPFSGERNYTVPDNPTSVNGVSSSLQAFVLTDDEGGEYTYYKLRDLGRALNFNVDWSAERGVFIETDKPYSGI